MNKQLYEKENNINKPFFPVVRLEDIIDTISEKSIQWILNNYNHIYVEWKNDIVGTRLSVPTILRRNGLWITYNNGDRLITEYYIGKNTEIKDKHWQDDANWEDYTNKLIDGTVEYRHLSENLKQLFNKGNVTNFPDEEDLTSDGVVLSFKDREYQPENFSGLGRVILRKNIVKIGEEYKNILTQSMINKENTIYEIRYDFDLNGQEITIPEGCVLDFQGGSFSNGTIDLNNCKFINKGLKNVRILNPHINYPISYFLGDVSNPSINKDVIQTIIDTNQDLTIDIPEIILDDYISIKQRATIQSNTRAKRILIFPNSRGFVWDGFKSYSHNNYFEGLIINAKEHCFDFSNSDSTVSTPYNIYDSQFENLIVNSEEGTCFYAGANKAFNGNGLVYEVQFQNININAPKGCGFYGFPKTTSYTNIYIQNTGIATICNCSGIFTCLNGANKNSSAPAFLATAGTSQQVTFNFCNFEDYHSTIFKAEGGSFQWLEFNQCSFHFYGDENGKINYYPFNFIWIRAFTFKKNRYFFHNTTGEYLENHSLLHIYNTEGLVWDTDTDIEISIRGQRKLIIPAFNLINFGNSPSTYNNSIYIGNNKLNLQTDIIRANLLFFESHDILIDNPSSHANKILNFGDFEFYNIIAANDIEGNVIEFSSPQAYQQPGFQMVPRKATIKNGNANCIIIFNHIKSGSGNSHFYNKTNSNITLLPGQIVNVTIYPKGYYGNYSVCYVDIPQIMEDITTRPTKQLYEGLQYFDTTLNKPIWWTGTKWVDATGADV